jgi:glyoxylase I family protein
VLRVSDVARSLRFYCDVLGCSEERRIEPLGLFQLRAGASLIRLQSHRQEKQCGGAAAA